MDFDQLEQLIAIDEQGSMNAAATKLHISQPALSRSIQRLETELGTPLFERHGRQVSFNAGGKLALEHARQILCDKQLMQDAISDQARKARALRVGTVAPAPLWRLTALIVERYPQVLLSSESLDPADIERKLINGEVDLAISQRPCMFPTVRSHIIMTESLSVSLPKAHPLARKRSLSAAELDGETFLLAGNIGFWQSYCDELYPHSTFVVQQDRVVFEQLLNSTELLFFTSDAPSLVRPIKGRRIIPLRDTAAHATFYLLMNQNARAEAQDIFEWVSSQVG